MMRDYYGLLDALEPGTLERYDREESGRQYGGVDEYEDHGGIFGFSALDRDEQAAILCTLDTFLPTHTKRINRKTPTSYGLKHDLERCTGFYCSNLQCKVGMRLLGFKRDEDRLNPFFNVARGEWRRFHEESWRRA